MVKTSKQDFVAKYNIQNMILKLGDITNVKYVCNIFLEGDYWKDYLKENYYWRFYTLYNYYSVKLIKLIHICQIINLKYLSLNDIKLDL